MLRNWHEDVDWSKAENKRYLAECEKHADDARWAQAVRLLDVYLYGDLCDCGDWDCVTSIKPGGK